MTNNDNTSAAINIESFIRDNFQEIHNQALAKFIEAWLKVTPEAMIDKFRIGEREHGAYTITAIADPFYEIYMEALDISNYTMDTMLKLKAQSEDLLVSNRISHD